MCRYELQLKYAQEGLSIIVMVSNTYHNNNGTEFLITNGQNFVSIEFWRKKIGTSITVKKLNFFRDKKPYFFC